MGIFPTAVRWAGGHGVANGSSVARPRGEVLYTIELPGTQNGHPITYEVDGRQLIVLSVGARGQAPELVALALQD